MSMSSLLKRSIFSNPWKLSFLLNSIVFLIICFFPIGYGVNDDVQIEWLIFHDASPWGMTVFVHPFLTLIVKQLGVILPSVPWYSCMMYGLTWLSFSILLGVLFKFISSINGIERGVARALYAIAMTGVTYFAIDAYLYMQYTQTALLCMLAGLSFDFLSFQEKSSWIVRMAGIILFALGFAIRADAIYILLPFFALFVLGEFIYAKGWLAKKEILSRFLPIILLGGFSVLLLVMSGHYIILSYPEWKSTDEKIKYQSHNVDYPDFSGITKDYGVTGLTRNELNMYQSNVWLPPYSRTLEKMRNYDTVRMSDQPVLHHFDWKIGKKLLIISKWAVPVGFLYFFLICFTRNRRLLFSTIPLVFLLLLYVYIGRVAGRVLFGTYLCAFSFLLISQHRLLWSGFLIWRSRMYQGIMGLTLLVETIAGWIIAHHWNRHNAVDTSYDEYHYFASQPDRIFFCADVPFIYPRNPFLHTKKRFDANSLSLLGWFIYTPTYEGFMEQKLADKSMDTYRKIVQEDNLFFVTPLRSKEADFPFADCFIPYISDVNQIGILPVHIEDTERHSIWKLVKSHK